MKDLADLHYYLKAEHEFTPAEVEALLSFQDPLDVAHWCWEDNPHEHSFPICELLDKIDEMCIRDSMRGVILSAAKSLRSLPSLPSTRSNPAVWRAIR